MAVSIKIMQLKRVLDASQLLHPLTFGMTVSQLFQKKFDFSSHISSKNELKEAHSKRNMVDNSLISASVASTKLTIIFSPQINFYWTSTDPSQ